MNAQEPSMADVPRHSFEAISGFVCPKCKGALQVQGDAGLYCPKDHLSFAKQNNIWRFLLPDRQKHFEQFLKDYETIREREGRGAHDPAFYRALPFKDLTSKFVDDWKIRAITYSTFLEQVLQPFHDQADRQLHILDLGAGNGWLSNRLKQLGNLPVAVDLCTNSFDGLGACVFYRDPFPAIQAEADSIPFADGHFDLVIFNASLHYSEDLVSTLTEALRVLTDEGRLVVLDTPIYHDRSSGEQMVKEREESFYRQFGFRSDALASENFLTFGRLDDLAKQCHLEWRLIRPNYGLKWHLKPLLARVRRSREPAQFLILVANHGNRES